MAERMLYVDSDAFILLAGAGLLSEGLALLGYDLHRVRRLAPLPYMIQRTRKLRERYGPEAMQRTLLACETVSPLQERPADDQLLQLLADVPNVDPGEAQLFATVASDEAYFLLSGDKRAVIAVGSEPSLRPVRDAVAGRVFVLEQVLKSLANRMPVSKLARRFGSLRESHQTLKVVLSEGCQKDPDEYQRGIAGYLCEIEDATGTGFLCPG